MERTEKQEIQKPVKLNLGCGHDYRSDYVNVDHPRTVTKKDIPFDLDCRPWPFDTASVDEVYMNASLEHLDHPDEVLYEVARILKKGGIFHGAVPYAHADGAYYQMDHRWFFTELSFNAFCISDSGETQNDVAFNTSPFKKIYVKLVATATTPKTFLRCLIPGRRLLRHFIRNMYDDVHFKLERI